MSKEFERFDATMRRLISRHGKPHLRGAERAHSVAKLVREISRVDATAQWSGRPNMSE
jgi:hypothetical protein